MVAPRWRPGDRSGNNNSGTWYGSMTNGSYYTGGKINQAGNFNGTDDYINIGTWMDNLGMGSLTLSSWFKSGVGSSNIILSNYSWTPEFVLNNGAYTLRGTDGIYHTLSTTVFSDSQWHFIVGTRQGDNYYLYIDGLAVQNGNGVSGVNVNGGGSCTIIGGGNNYPCPPNMGTLSKFSGLIDDVRIYNRALSAAEIQAIYNAQK